MTLYDDPVLKARFTKVRPWDPETNTEYRVAIRERVGGRALWLEYGRVRSVRSLLGRGLVTTWEWRELAPDDCWSGCEETRTEAMERLVEHVRASEVAR